MQKRNIHLLFLMLNTFLCSSQSLELKNAFNQVTNTLKNYDFESANVHSVKYEEYVTKSIKASFKYPLLIISFTEGYKSSWAFTTDDKAKPGVHKIEIPIYGTVFEIGKVYSGTKSRLSISNSSGITYIVNSKKELLESYSIWGSKLNVTKLYEELKMLQRIIQAEQYKGTLGVSLPKEVETKPSEKKRIESVPKKAGKYIN